MKTQLQTLWFWVFSAFALILALLAYILWDSYQPKKSSSVEESISSAADKQAQETIAATPNTVNPSAEVDPSLLPAPAKKLQQLLQQAEGEEDALSQRIEALNQQLADINAQLSQQGIEPLQQTVPTETEVTADQQSLSKRQQNIKDFMKNKEQQVSDQSI